MPTINFGKDFYMTLGVEKNATTSEVKRAYHSLMLKYHPDKFPGDTKIALEKTKDIVEAYEVLSHDDQRQRYDSYHGNTAVKEEKQAEKKEQQANSAQTYSFRDWRNAWEEIKKNQDPSDWLNGFTTALSILYHSPLKFKKDLTLGFITENFETLKTKIDNAEIFYKVFAVCDPDIFPNILSDFGQEFIRKIFASKLRDLTHFLSNNNREGHKKEFNFAVLDFLNKNNQWLYTQFSNTHQLRLLVVWDPVLPPGLYLDRINPNWRDKILSVPGEIKTFIGDKKTESHDDDDDFLSALLGTDPQQTPDTINIREIQLIQHLTEKSLAQIISNNNQPQEQMTATEKGDALRQNLELIDALTDTTIAELLRYRSFNATLVDMLQYKDRPYFSVYLLATTRALIVYERIDYAGSLTPNMFNHHLKNIAAAEQLSQAILKNEPIDVAKFTKKELKTIAELYMESHTVVYEPYFDLG